MGLLDLVVPASKGISEVQISTKDLVSKRNLEVGMSMPGNPTEDSSQTSQMLFQKYLGVPPVQYVTQYRLEKASTLLRSTGFSVTEIAYTCGFSNTSYFCELFHKYYHTTPKLYRNQIV